MVARGDKNGEAHFSSSSDNDDDNEEEDDWTRVVKQTKALSAGSSD